MLKNFISALQFLTVFRIQGSDGFEPGKMLPMFPLVGISIGIMLVMVDAITRSIWPAMVAALLDLLFLIWVSGGLHMDGLGDTADGLYGHRPTDKALEIMKDSRMGAMGVMAIFFGLSVKWGGLAAIDAHRSLVLLLVPAFARSSPLIGVKYLPYGRREGLGREFCLAPIPWRVFRWVSVPVLLALCMGVRGLGMIAAFIIVNAGVTLFYKNRVNCITGDMMGAQIEICEAVLLLTAAAGGVMT